MPDCRRVVYPNESGDDIEDIVYFPRTSTPRPRARAADRQYPRRSGRLRRARVLSSSTPLGRPGYVVFRPNYRGSSPTGRRSRSHPWRLGPPRSEDVARGCRVSRERVWADSDRIFVHRSLLRRHRRGLSRDTDRTASPRRTRTRHLRPPFCVRNRRRSDLVGRRLRPAVGGEGDLRSSSSITRRRQRRDAPVGHGGWRGLALSAHQSEQLYISVKKQGVDAKLVVYPDEHHNIGDPDGRTPHRTLKESFTTHDPERPNETLAVERFPFPIKQSLALFTRLTYPSPGKH